MAPGTRQDNPRVEFTCVGIVAWAAGHGLYFSSCVLLSLLVLPSLYPVSLAQQAHMSIDGSQRKGLVGLPTLSY